MAFLADVLSRVKPSATMAMTQKARDLKAKGRKVISLSVGEPDFDTPDNIKHAAIEAIERGRQLSAGARHSSVARGDRSQVQARERARLQGLGHDRRHRESRSLQRLPGHHEQGDEVFIPAPYWVGYPEWWRSTGGPGDCADHVERGFKLKAEDLERAITPRQMGGVQSPSNPSGAAYMRDELKGSPMS